MDTATQPAEPEELEVFRRAWQKKRAERAKKERLAKIREQRAAQIQTETPGSSIYLSSLGQENVQGPNALKRSFPDIFNATPPVATTPSTRHGLAHQTATLPVPQITRKFVVALDYGTTFTSACYSVHPMNEDRLWGLPQDVKTIENWPCKGSSGSKLQVPSESWYPSAPGERSKFIKENLLEDDISDIDDETIMDDGASQVSLTKSLLSQNPYISLGERSGLHG